LREVALMVPGDDKVAAADDQGVCPVFVSCTGNVVELLAVYLPNEHPRVGASSIAE